MPNDLDREGRFRLDALAAHMAVPEFVGRDLDSLIFTGEQGSLMRPGNFRRATHWHKACSDAGMPPGFTFHDLRHTGNTLASATSASTKELIAPHGLDNAGGIDLPARLP